MSENTDDGFPTLEEMELPLLEEIRRQGGKVKVSDLYKPLAEFFNLPEEKLHIMHPRLKQRDPRWRNDVQRTRDRLLKKGELYPTEVSGHRIYQITPKGEVRLEGNTPLQEHVERQAQKVVAPNLSIRKAVEPLFDVAERTKNILLYGPPGTGKTWRVMQFAKAFTEPDKVRMVTFHQSFAYEEFVEGIKPVNDEKGQVLYRIESGVFKSICHRAQEDPDGRYLLIIDEINRANIAKVLGELITLIEDDKRLGEANEAQVTLPYSGERFGVPPNLTILGTMNTADRSIALLDLALRRRFTFVEMPPDPSLLSENMDGVNLRDLLTRLNKRVGALLDPDHRIGHSYLMSVKTADDLHFAWYRRIVPLLQEYFYHDGERLQAVLGKAFVTETALDVETKSALGAAYEDAARYEVKELEGEEFLEALRDLAGMTV